ncbi:MAG: hypothetical protein NT098_02850 [Candidatus Parcubacteria bacterium]|nr:hypothetical protein [Candidatus Parcubacteria bacterium]
MTTFITGVYYLPEIKKWVPSGQKMEWFAGSHRITEIAMREYEFETEEEARGFFIRQCKKRGWVEGKKMK